MAHLGTSMCIGVVLPQHIDVGEDEALALLAPRERRPKGARKRPGIGKATVRKVQGDDPSWWAARRGVACRAEVAASPGDHR